MAVDFYLLPKTAVGADPLKARDWLDHENRQLADVHSALDPAAETRKRKLAELVLNMNLGFEEFDFQYEQIAEFERISADEARRKYRRIELNGPSVQVSVLDRYVAVGVFSRVDPDELDAVLAALSTEGGFVAFDPQRERVVDLSKESL